MASDLQQPSPSVTHSWCIRTLIGLAAFFGASCSTPQIHPEGNTKNGDRKIAFVPAENNTSSNTELLITETPGFKYELLQSSQDFQSSLQQILQDKTTEGLFVSLPDFDDKSLFETFCKSLKHHPIPVHFVIGEGTNATYLDQLAKCNARPTQYKRRGQGSGFGYANNRLVVTNPFSKPKKQDNQMIRVLFGGQNLWNSVLVHRDTYFVQSHLCHIRSLWDDENAKRLDGYVSTLQSCRAGLTLKEESDLKVFFVPADGDRASRFILEKGVKKAAHIKLITERFFFNALHSALNQRANTVSILLSRNPASTFEANSLKSLENNGSKTHTQISETTLNPRFILFENDLHEPESVFLTGGQFTATAFKNNLENHYFIRIPSIVKSLSLTYETLWTESTPL